MYKNIGLFRLSSDFAAHAVRRQNVAAQNLANVDTPGYKRQHISTFQTELTAMPVRISRNKHMAAPVPNRLPDQSKTQGHDPNGNTVSLEDELADSVAAKSDHDRAIAIYHSTLKLIRSSLGKQ